VKFEVPYILKKYRVSSKSEKGTYYIVEVWNDGKLTCNCPAGSFGRLCNHKQRVNDQIQK